MIQTAESSIQYFGNNSTSTPYPIPFLFYEAGTIKAVVRDELGVEDEQVLGTDFTVTGAGNPDGGSLLTTWAIPATSSITIFRVVPYTQETAYEEGDSFPAQSHERALDKLTMECQQLSRSMGTGTGDASDLGTSFRVTEASGTLTAVGKITDSSLGIDALGNTVLRTPGEMVGWMGQVGTAWEDTAERLATLPSYVGQLGFQRDIKAIFYALSIDHGAWAPYFFGEGIVISEATGAPGVILRPEGDIVGTTEAQALYNKTLDHPAIVAPTGITKADVGLGNVDNVSDASKPVSGPQAAALSGKQSIGEKGMQNGYPSLDASGKIPLPQIPDAILGASQYQGTWNAATNTPTIPAAALGNKGWYYSVGTAGTTNIDGINSWAVGDQIISNGTVWQKIVNVSAVSSVNAKTGAVVINQTDVGLSNVSNTSDATKNSAVATLTNKTIAGADNTLSVRLENDVTGNLPVARLNAGTGATGATWWCGDGTWKQPIGAGDVVGPALSADNDVALFSGLTGKIIKSGGKPLSNFIEGPASAVADHIPQFSGTTGKLLKDGKAAPVGIIVGDIDTQTLTNKSLTDPINTHGGVSYRPAGVILSVIAAMTSTGGVEETPWTFTIPANWLKDGDSIRITSLHINNAIAATRRLRLLLGSTVFYEHTTVSATAVIYHHNILVTRYSSTVMRYLAGRMQDNNAAAAEYGITTPVDWSVPNVLSCTIFAATTGQVIHRMALLEFLPAP